MLTAVIHTRSRPLVAQKTPNTPKIPLESRKWHTESCNTFEGEGAVIFNYKTEAKGLFIIVSEDTLTVKALFLLH